jgi:CheY-like chemotaxis protein
MGKTYILGNNKDLAKYLEYDFIEIPTIMCSNDYEIHNWLVNVFQHNEIEKLVIEIGSDVVLPFQIAYHIRLSINELKYKSLIPILFVSTTTLNSIVLKASLWSHILSTKGVYFSSISDFEKIKLELSVVEEITSEEYKSEFWDIIKVLPGEVMGRHSLANVWGAYSMDKAANTNILRFNSDFQSRSGELYFKYVSAINNLKTLNIKTVGYINLSPSCPIDAKNRKILLIDDEADKGWESVLRKIFSTNLPDDFVVINEKVKDYDKFTPKSKSIIENEHFDLYLIDLRLGGLEEDGILKPDDFSGMKVMRKIKSINPGNQVIIFTASNKVWNLKALLDAGADGYYMKESPEFAFTNEFSVQNYLRFKDDVQRCFDRSYLKSVYLDIQDIKVYINKIGSTDFKNELLNQFDLFWSMISKSISETDYAYSFINLYFVIEIINKYSYQQTTDGKWLICQKENLLYWQWDQSEKAYVNTNLEITINNPPEWQKIAGLWFQKWGQSDSQFIMNIFFLIQKRNGFVHGDKKILDKQDNNNQYLNRDIFTKVGIEKLLSAVKMLIQFL